MTKAERFTEPCTFHGEGPFWDSVNGRLLLVDLAAGDGEVRELTRGADGEISGLAWSPDSQWLAYADPVESGLSRIAMVRPADGVVVAVTEPRFVDVSPTFTTDGRYLAFLVLYDAVFGLLAWAAFEYVVSET